MKIGTSEIKKWTILKIEWSLYRVIDTAHTHMGRGGATDKFKVKDIITWKVNNFTYNAGSVLEQAEISTNRAVYLYNTGDTYTFMENDTGETYDINSETIEDITGYLKDNMDCYLTVYEGNVIWVLLPPTVSYLIKSTVPGVKWDRAQAGKKPATLETWLEVMIPLHKNEGDSVIVNTETGDAS